MVKHQPSKLVTRVRFPSPALAGSSSLLPGIKARLRSSLSSYDFHLGIKDVAKGVAEKVEAEDG